MTEAIEQIWNDLIETTSTADGYERRRIEPESTCNLFLAIKKPENIRCLQMEVNSTSIPSDIKYPETRGLELTPVAIRPGPRGYIMLSLSVRISNFNDIFSVLVSDIIWALSRCTSEKECVDEFIIRLTRWQSLLERFESDGLNNKEQQGLYGELWFLRAILIPAIDCIRSVESWTGPGGSNQDFQVNNNAVEIKTTSNSPHQVVHISNVHQLDSTGIENLYLTHIAMDVRNGDERTLPLMVNDIREIIGGNQQALDEFERKLRATGYLDVHADIYARRKYTIRFKNHYIVQDGFPKLLESNIPNGVGDVRYSITMSVCDPFRIDEDELISSLRQD